MEEKRPNNVTFKLGMILVSERIPTRNTVERMYTGVETMRISYMHMYTRSGNSRGTGE